jgi:hypothetical protein
MLDIVSDWFEHLPRLEAGQTQCFRSSSHTTDNLPQPAPLTPKQDSHERVTCTHIRTIGYKDFSVSYRSCNGWVNASHIFKIAGQNRARAATYWLGTEGSVRRDIVRGNPQLQGTYVSWEQSLKLCDEILPGLKSVLQSRTVEENTDTSKNLVVSIPCIH